MTEAEWLACAEPSPMLSFLKGKASDRKLRLFACACYRRMWDRLHVFTREVVATSERLADGLAGEEDLRVAADGAWDWPGHPSPDAGWVASALPHEAAERSARWAASYLGQLHAPSRWREAAEDEALAQCATLKDLVGNPFRPVAIEPARLTESVLALARAIYDARAFDRLPLLADALEEAGCDSQEILDHCRSGGEHVRGCWVVDLLLGKS
jgi:hypothetical protein